MFPDKMTVQNIQKELDQIIHTGVQNITKLAQESDHLSNTKNTIVNSSGLSLVS